MGGTKYSSFARKNGEIVASCGQIDSEKYLASPSNSLGAREQEQKFDGSIPFQIPNYFKDSKLMTISFHTLLSCTAFMYTHRETDTLFVTHPVNTCLISKSTYFCTINCSDYGTLIVFNQYLHEMILLLNKMILLLNKIYPQGVLNSFVF